MDAKKIKNAFSRKPPGSRTYAGNSTLETSVRHFQYRNQFLTKKEDIFEYSNEYVDWITIEGFQDVGRIKEIGEKLKFHPLTMDDILSVTQRNKFEVKEENLFVVLKYVAQVDDQIEYKYLSVVLNENNIVTLTDYENPFIEVLHESIKSKYALISKNSEDFLLYVVYDMVVDDQISLLDSLDQKLYDYESEVLDTTSSFSTNIYKLHKELVLLRNNVKSLKDNVSPLKLLENKFVSDQILIYLEDLDDHVNNLLERCNSSIELCNSLISLYSIELSNRTNNVMKTLTIISVIFIPLSFVAGVFGMNFVNIPFLSSNYGFTLFIIFSIFLVTAMLYYFKKKKWL